MSKRKGSGTRARRARRVRFTGGPALTPNNPVIRRKNPKRSKYVALGVVGGVIAFCGFGPMVYDETTKKCVDNNNQVIDNSNCRSSTGHGRWYYGGSRSGSKITGGSFERAGFGGRLGGGS